MSGEPSNGKIDLKNLDLKLKVTLAADRNAIDPVVQSIMQVVRDTECAHRRDCSRYRQSNRSRPLRSA